MDLPEELDPLKVLPQPLVVLIVQLTALSMEDTIGLRALSREWRSFVDEQAQLFQRCRFTRPATLPGLRLVERLAVGTVRELDVSFVGRRFSSEALLALARCTSAHARALRVLRVCALDPPCAKLPGGDTGISWGALRH